ATYGPGAGPGRRGGRWTRFDRRPPRPRRAANAAGMNSRRWPAHTTRRPRQTSGATAHVGVTPLFHYIKTGGSPPGHATRALGYPCRMSDAAPIEHPMGLMGGDF